MECDKRDGIHFRDFQPLMVDNLFSRKRPLCSRPGSMILIKHFPLLSTWTFVLPGLLPKKLVSPLPPKHTNHFVAVRQHSAILLSSCRSLPASSRQMNNSIVLTILSVWYTLCGFYSRMQFAVTVSTTIKHIVNSRWNTN